VALKLFREVHAINVTAKLISQHMQNVAAAQFTKLPRNSCNIFLGSTNYYYCNYNNNNYYN